MKTTIMRALSVSLVILFITPGAFCQSTSTKGINYQAVARDATGQPLANKKLSVDISLVSGKNIEVWDEAQWVTTNEFGLFTLVIGQGVSTTKGSASNFSQINWGDVPFTAKIQVDFGQGLQDMGEVVLQSVPYAFLADSALKAPIPDLKLDQLSNVDTKNITTNEALVWNGKKWAAGSSVKMDSLVLLNNLTIYGKIISKGSLHVEDSVTTDIISANTAALKNLQTNDVHVKGNVTVDSNVNVADTLKVKFIKAGSIEGNILGLVIDLSKHSVTELDDVTSAGSGKIITDSERQLLLSLPASISNDSAIITTNASAEVSTRLASDNNLSVRIGNDSSKLATEITNRIAGDSTEAVTRLASDNSLSVRIGNDSSKLVTEITNRIAGDSTEAVTRLASDNSLSVRIGNDSSKLATEITNRIAGDSTEAVTRLASNNSLSVRIGNDSSKLATEITNRITGDNTEAAARLAFDNSLSVRIGNDSSSLATEINNRIAMDTSFSKRITNDSIRLNGEITRATDAEAGKEILSNKSTSIIADATSDTKYPSVKAAKTYIDNTVAAGAPDASTVTKGLLQLTGDLAGTADSPSVASVGGSSAADINAATVLANNATNTNLPGTIVERDASGNFSANTITANLTGNVTGNINGLASNVSGVVAIANWRN